MYGSEQAIVEKNCIKKIGNKIFGFTHIGERSRHNYLMDAINFLDLPYSARILNAGSGNGAHSFFLSQKHPEWEIINIEIDSDLINKCQRITQKLKLKCLSFICQDLVNIEYKDTFDLIFSIHVLPYIKNDSLVLNNFYNALKPEGFLIISAPRRFNPIHIKRLKKKIEKVNRMDWNQKYGHVRDGYTNKELIKKLQDQNFCIEVVSNPNGLFYQIAREVACALEGKIFLKMLFYPLLLLLVYSDKLQKNSNSHPKGMGILIVARKFVKCG